MATQLALDKGDPGVGVVTAEDGLLEERRRLRGNLDATRPVSVDDLSTSTKSQWSRCA